MRIRVRLLGSVALLTVLWVYVPAVGQTPLSLVVRPSHDALATDSGIEKTGAPIFLIVDLVNNSEQSLSASQWDFVEDYTFDVRDAQGRAAPQTSALRDVLESSKPGHRRAGHGMISRIAPGGTWKERFELTEYYDLSRPGTYTIQLERRLPEELGNGNIKSNKITITVLPADTPPPGAK